VKLEDLVATSKAVSATSSRLEKTDRLADLLTRLSPAEIDIAVPFLTGSMRQGRIGIGWSLLGGLRDTPPADSATLELTDVDACFERVSAESGAGSSSGKADRVRDLLRRATHDEQQFLVNLIFGELRQGAMEGVLVDAVARAARLPAERVRRATMIAGTLTPVARAALVEGEQALDALLIQLFRPVAPMLAQSAESVEDTIDELGRVALEYKVDGARIQVHKQGDEVRVYSRNLRDVSAAVPEIVEIARSLPPPELILDGEAITFQHDGRPAPFQTTMRRFGRKLDVDALRRELPIYPIFFDALYLDGQPLVDEPLTRRIALVEQHVAADWRVPRIVTDDRETASAFLTRAITEGHEGLMAKAVDGTYAAGRRGQAWIKVKRARTLDLVVLAAEWGHGRRQGTLSNLHLGARDEGGFVMLGKTFKGMTDEMLAWQTKRLLELEVARDSYTVYVRPELVVEVAFNEIQASPQYPGGVTLRFARVKRYRTDKSAAEADTLATIRTMFAG
jgi:ATP-dependent DNA ligase I